MLLNTLPQRPHCCVPWGVSVVHYIWYTLLSPPWGMWRAHHMKSRGHEVSIQPKHQILFITVIEAHSSLQAPCFATSSDPQIYLQLYCKPSVWTAGLTLRRWLVCVPPGGDSALPDNSFTAQRPSHWWQQLSLSQRIRAETRNSSKRAWVWKYQRYKG